VIEAEASRALSEMRSMVRVLRRDDAAELAPTPTVLDLQKLAGHDHGGPTIDVHLAGPFDELAAPVASAVFRIAQESVTNARRHARDATRIDMRVDVDDSCVRVTVVDDGAPGPVSTQGYGIVGMTERAAMLGGTCAAGHAPGGGWSVAAELPRRGAAA
jgi:signal transduction histidine kinase